ncbi:MAG: hypothetical protein P3W90_001950 [Paracoccus sp. (in: a-proteobacteria)]|nr:hypothetical protein [Paracoccus sp. (in: a-proteobacteria)]
MEWAKGMAGAAADAGTDPASANRTPMAMAARRVRPPAARTCGLTKIIEAVVRDVLIPATISLRDVVALAFRAKLRPPLGGLAPDARCD